MNHCVPDWGMEDDLKSFHDLFPASNEKKSMAPDNELVELLWRNGHVVMQSQNNRKSPTNGCELKQAQKPNPQLKPVVPLVSPSNLIQDETASWFQYTIDDSLEKEFCSEFLDEMPMTYTIDTNKPNKEVMKGLDGNSFTMPPPKSHIGDTQMASSKVNGSPANFSHFSRPMKADMVSSSIRTVGSSACRSNQVQNQTDVSYNLSKGVKEGSPMISPKERPRANTFDTTMTSSSGGSGCSFWRTTGHQSTTNLSHKRKGRDGEESECHSEEAEYESMEANRPTQRPASTRNSRAAEVHNQSERRRRDRINEKMKALQELIPHCNKSDKASMLDEVIEYLKSLQLQLQLMWMGSGMTTMMFPGVQQYMSRVGIGMGHASIPSINNQIQLPRNPLANHSMPSTPSSNQMPMCASPTINPISFPTQMQNVHLPESYAPYFGFPHMQLPAQPVNLYTYGSHIVQQNQTAGSSSLPTAGIPSENIQNGRSEKVTGATSCSVNKFYPLVTLCRFLLLCLVLMCIA